MTKWLGAMAVVLAIGSCGYEAPSPESDRERMGFPARGLQNVFHKIAKGSTPGVVYIHSLNIVKPLSFSELMDSGLGFRHALRIWLNSFFTTKYSVRNSGSGFLMSERGYILTNYHVIKGADRVMVQADSREYEAEQLGYDPLSDIAMIKVDADYRHKPLKMGDSDALEVGEWVVSIGNPYGLDSTFTVGVVSALRRDDLGIIELEDFIQTDAAINPGNSGGPLINIEGEVVGINTAIHSEGTGLGFAVPINIARKVFFQLVSGRKVLRGMLGVGLQELTPELAKGLKVDVDAGVLVSMVKSGSPAEKAGIRQGDVISRLNGEKQTDYYGFKRSIVSLPPGSKVEIEVIREGKKVVLEAELAVLEALT